MKGKVVKREIIHNLELTEEELKGLAYICKYFMSKDNSPLPIMQEHADVCKDILNYVDNKTFITLEEDKPDYDLLDNETIYIMNNRLVRELDEDCDIVAYIGKQQQLILKFGSMGKTLFFNKECAILIRDFIDRLGEGMFRGIASYNSSEYFELDLYLDNKGNKVNTVIPTKALVQRYYYSLEGTPFGISKDDDNEVRLNYAQAQLLSKFISRHF